MALALQGGNKKPPEGGFYIIQIKFDYFSTNLNCKKVYSRLIRLPC